jgi:hypothetical protein
LSSTRVLELGSGTFSGYSSARGAKFRGVLASRTSEGQGEGRLNTVSIRHLTLQQIVCYLAAEQPFDYHEETESGHGRIEVRRYWTTPVLTTLPQGSQWADLQIIGRVEAERHRTLECTRRSRCTHPDLCTPAFVAMEALDGASRHTIGKTAKIAIRRDYMGHGVLR